MTSLSVMDWNAKTPLQWDWENMIMFNAKAAENPKPTDWGNEVEGGIDNGSLYSSGDGGCVGGGGSGSGCAASDVGHVSSSRSSKSASVDSSSIERTSESRFKEFVGFHGHLSNKKELGKANQSESSLILKASEGSGEPLIGLKLGKRTYFEDFCTGSNGKDSSISVNPMSSAPSAKRSGSSSRNIPPRCQVEGCNLDLSSAKEYHRKHRICESHSKCPKVVVNGLERRFCQQCSRFHGLKEFDEKKRSCRKRLSDHNARRRKPQHETIPFNSARLGSFLYDGRQQMELSRFPFVHMNPVANLTLENTCNSKFTLTKECPLRTTKTRGIDGQLHLPNNEPPNAVGMLYHDSEWLLPSKGGSAEILNEDLDGSMISTNSDAAQDLHRALSLLSTNSWGSCEPQAAFVDHRMAVSSTRMPHSPIDAVSHGLPLPASENWRTEQSSDLQMHTFTGQNNGNGHFPEFQLFKVPYGSGY